MKKRRNNMKKHISVLVTAQVLVLGLGTMVSADLWNTGVDGAGVALAYGTADPHYTLTSVPSGSSTALAIVPHPNWVAPPADARWIAPTPYDTSDPGGLFVFETTFNVGSVDGLVVSGKWATDNSGAIWLNGVDTGIVRAFGAPGDYGFSSLEEFEITTGFIANSVNTLAFRVTNGDPTQPNANQGPMGLLVTDMNMQVVPVPGAVLLGMLGLGAAGMKLRKRV